MGIKHFEGVALLAGVAISETEFDVRVTIIPEQTAYNHDNGLLYTVSGEELYRLNMWLYENKFTLICQIHSHPGAAYHSDTDDAFPIITVQGGVSIVIPNFGFGEIEMEQWAVYRLVPGEGWQPLATEETKQLLNIL